MGELATLAKARQELEDLYVGVPDESVNLSFQHLAQLQQQYEGVDKTKTNMAPIEEVNMKGDLGMGKSPSLDFSKAIHASRPRGHEDKTRHAGAPRGHHHHLNVHVNNEVHIQERVTTPNSARRNNLHTGYRSNIDNSLAYDDTSVMSGMSGMSGISRASYQERGGRRRAGLPHTNICTVCSTYIYIFRHRCLVCGRVYCRDCVGLGMGDMSEGRKCVECLGRKFSQRYISKAGSGGCCSMGLFARYPSMVMQQELKWAEKGPRRSREREGFGGRSGMMSRSRSPVTPRTPTRAHISSSPSSFVTSTQFSPYSATHPHIPY